MNVIPICLRTEEVRAILDGRKHVMRRAIKPQPSGRPFPMPEGSCWPGYFKIEGTDRVIKPPHQPGDILYVRETWQPASTFNIDHGSVIFFKAGGSTTIDKEYPAESWTHYHPSTYMPKEAARIFLLVKAVRAERLKDITNEQAMAEGVRYTDFGTYAPSWNLFKPIHHAGYHFMDAERPEQCFNNPRYAFANYWSRNTKPADRPLYGWAANPWAYVTEFERLKDPPAGFYGDKNPGSYADSPVLAPAT